MQRLRQMRTSDFDYTLPVDRIAQTPIEPRDAARLMVVHRETGALEHRIFRDLVEYVRPGDLLIANDSRVIPARLYARKVPTGGRVELLLLHRHAECTWEALVKGRKVAPGTKLELTTSDILDGGDRDRQDTRESRKTQRPADEHREVKPVHAEVLAVTSSGGRLIRFDQPIMSQLETWGQTPLPPYIHEPLGDRERYQTVYARVQGSTAAPTAGLHFTPQLIQRIRERGGEFAFVTLHIGLDTFRPVQVEQIEDHKMHSEYAVLPAETATAIDRTRQAGGRIIAVGTTAVRVLETAAQSQGHTTLSVGAFSGWTDLFIYPGYQFRIVDALITNFHLPRSTLLMLVSAFAGQGLVFEAYGAAIREGYRFYSFGDAMLIL